MTAGGRQPGRSRPDPAQGDSRGSRVTPWSPRCSPPGYSRQCRRALSPTASRSSLRPVPAPVLGLIASLYIGKLLLLVLNVPLAPVRVRALKIRRPWPYGGILPFAIMGAPTLNNNVVDFVIPPVIGLLGLVMRVMGVLVAPCVVGLILGPLAEQQLRRALAISQGDPTVIFSHPVAPLLTIAALLVIAPVVLRRHESRRQAGGAAGGRRRGGLRTAGRACRRLRSSLPRDRWACSSAVRAGRS